MRTDRGLGRWTGLGALRSERGGVAIASAFAAPMLLLLAGGATDMRIAAVKRTQLQNALDAAVLAGAKAEAADAVAAAEAVFEANKGDLNIEPVFTPDGDRVSSDVTLRVPTSFLTAVGVGYLPVRASAEAFAGSVAPYCVLLLEPSSTALTINARSRLDAQVCGVQVNSTSSSAVLANNNGRVLSESLCVTGRVLSNGAQITAPAQTGCPTRSDPFAGMAAPSVGDSCPNRLADRRGETLELEPGCHGNITVQNKGKIVFKPGVHKITGNVIGNSETSVSGTEVLLYFAGNAAFTMNARSHFSLTGMKTGPYKGFVMFGDRGAGQTSFILNADVTGAVEGTVYLPKGVITLNSDVAANADYTLFIAKQMIINAEASQTIRNSYNADTPLPEAFRRVRLES